MNDITRTPPSAALVTPESNLTWDSAAGNLGPSPGPGPGPGSGPGTHIFNAYGDRLRSIFAQPAVARALPLIGIIALLGAAVLLWSILSAPDQRMLAERMADTDKAAVAQVLDSSGIAYTFDTSTGALTVADTQYHAARMALASAGLPKAAPDGDTMLSSLPLGASRAVEGEKLRLSREMDLARTIEAIDVVETARVHLALDAPSAFIRNRSSPTASVMLKLAGGRAISDGQVQAITHLVSASVPSLTANAVSVVDQDGKLLSSDGDDGAASQHLRIQTGVEDRYNATLANLLTPIVGADNFTAKVNADLVFDEKQATRETYPADDARVAREQGSWNADGNSASGAGYGVPGALSNQAPPAAIPSTVLPGTGLPGTGLPGAGSQVTAPVSGPPSGQAVVASDQKRTAEAFSRDFQLGREISVTRNATGTVRRLSIAVALRNTNPKKPRTTAEISAIENLVKSAVGFDAARGDQVAITARNFADAPPVETSIADAPWVASLIRNGSALVVILVLLLGVGRPLLKRRAAMRAQAEVQSRANIGQDISLVLGQNNAAFDPKQPVSLDMISQAPSYTHRAQLVRHFVRQNPEHAALVMRDLLAAGGAKS